MERLACGRLGLSITEFWESDLRSIANAMRGRAEAEQQRQTAELERTRLLAALLLQPYAPKGKRLKPSDLFKLPGEVPDAPKQRTRPAIWDKWDEEMKKRHGR